jgi:putative transposase
MLKAFKYRIYPTKAQTTKMERTLDLCRWTYNETLAYRKNSYESEGKSISKYETHNLLPKWKEDKPELKEVFSQILQNVQERVDLSLQGILQANQGRKEAGISQIQGKGLV